MNRNNRRQTQHNINNVNILRNKTPKQNENKNNNRNKQTNKKQKQQPYTTKKNITCYVLREKEKKT